MKTQKVIKKARKMLKKNVKKKHIRSGVAALSGLGAGALMMFLFDPQRGRGRRAFIRDKATGLKNDVQDTVSAKATHLSNRAKGVVHEARSAVFGSSGETDDLSASTH